MIRTATAFTTDNKSLQAVYDSAERVLLSSVKAFGDRRVLTTYEGGDRMTLNSEVLSAATLSSYDTEAAMNTVKAFLATRREDGRLADSLRYDGGTVCAKYEMLTGLCFAEEALSLFYLTRKKDDEYLKDLLQALLDFDKYLWEQHDLNFNNCLEIFNETETEEGEGTGRFMPIKVDHYGRVREVSPFPIESSDLMAMNVGLRHTIARIYSLLGDEENTKSWSLKAFEVQGYIRSAMWVSGRGVCFDRDYRGSIIDVVTVNNLFMMYYGALDREMADAFVSRYLRDPKCFNTAMPLTTISFHDRHFVNDDRLNFNGQPRSMTYRRAIGALEKYGYFSFLTHLGTKFLSAMGNCVFAEQFHPLTGKAVHKSDGEAYTPAASTTLEFIARFFGIRQHLDHLHWGALGHEDGHTSEYTFTWGGETFRLHSEQHTTAATVGDRPLFTVTNGVRVITDLYGNHPFVVNITEQPIDGILVYRDRTYSFTLNPDEQWEVPYTSVDGDQM